VRLSDLAAGQIEKRILTVQITGASQCKLNLRRLDRRGANRPAVCG
jgi:hypothetical protein